MVFFSWHLLLPRSSSSLFLLSFRNGSLLTVDCKEAGGTLVTSRKKSNGAESFKKRKRDCDRVEDRRSRYTGTPSQKEKTKRSFTEMMPSRMLRMVCRYS